MSDAQWVQMIVVHLVGVIGAFIWGFYAGHRYMREKASVMMMELAYKYEEAQRERAVQPSVGRRVRTGV